MVAINMEMPKNCVECPLFHFFIDTKGIIHNFCKYGNMEMCGDLKNKRSDFCPLIKADKVLDKIRDEIEEYKSRQLTLAIGVEDLEKGKQIALEYVLSIINKYEAESEVEE